MNIADLKDYDSADFLKTEEECTEYLKACAEHNDPELMIHAQDVVERVRKRLKNSPIPVIGLDE